MSSVTPPALGLATSAAAGASAPAVPGAQAGRAGVAKVAKQFEAIFIRQMLAAARKTSFDKDGDGDGLFTSQGSQTFMDMQDERFADIAASKGTFGLAAMIEKQLLARPNAAAGSASPAAPTASPAATGPAGG